MKEKKDRVDDALHATRASGRQRRPGRRHPASCCARSRTAARHRAQRGRRAVGGGGTRARGQGQLRLQRGHRRCGDLIAMGVVDPDQGDAHRAAERRKRGGAHPDHRRDDRGSAHAKADAFARSTCTRPRAGTARPPGRGAGTLAAPRGPFCVSPTSSRRCGRPRRPGPAGCSRGRSIRGRSRRCRPARRDAPPWKLRMPSGQ